MPPVGGFPPQAPGVPPTQPPTPASGTGGGSSKAGVVIALLVVALLIVGGVVAALLVLRSSSPELTLTIETCEIAADGALSASGTVSSSAAADVEVDVTFSGLPDGELVDRGQQTVPVPADAAQRWQVSGVAGDEVQRVTCDVTADD